MSGVARHQGAGADGAGHRFSETREEIRRFLGGDRTAGDRLLDRLRPQLEAFVRQRLRRIPGTAVRTRLSADDIVQDALVVAAAKLPAFDCRGPGAMLAWLRAIADNQVSDHLDHWHMQKRTPAREQALPDASASGDGLAARVAASASGPGTRAEERERSRLMAEALADLPEDTLQIVMLRVFYDAAWDEIASTLGLESGDAVRKRFARALPALAPRLQGLS